MGFSEAGVTNYGLMNCEKEFRNISVDNTPDSGLELFTDLRPRSGNGHERYDDPKFRRPRFFACCLQCLLGRDYGRENTHEDRDENLNIVPRDPGVRDDFVTPEFTMAASYVESMVYLVDRQTWMRSLCLGNERDSKSCGTVGKTAPVEFRNEVPAEFDEFMIWVFDSAEEGEVVARVEVVDCFLEEGREGNCGKVEVVGMLGGSEEGEEKNGIAAGGKCGIEFGWGHREGLEVGYEIEGADVRMGKILSEEGDRFVDNFVFDFLKLGEAREVFKEANDLKGELKAWTRRVFFLLLPLL